MGTFYQKKQFGFVLHNPLKHLFQLIYRVVDNDWASVRACEWVIRMPQLIKQGGYLIIAQMAISLNGAFTAHHNGCFFAQLFDIYLFQRQYLMDHFVDDLLLHPSWEPGWVGADDIAVLAERLKEYSNRLTRPRFSDVTEVIYYTT